MEEEAWIRVEKKTRRTKPQALVQNLPQKRVEFASSEVIIPKHSSSESQRVHKLEEADGPLRLKVLSLEMRQEITNRRVAKHWTQADLNKFCSFPQNTIRDIESGRLSPNLHQLTMLNRILKGGIRYAAENRL